MSETLEEIIIEQAKSKNLAAKEEKMVAQECLRLMAENKELRKRVAALERWKDMWKDSIRRMTSM